MAKTTINKAKKNDKIGKKCLQITSCIAETFPCSSDQVPILQFPGSGEMVVVAAAS